MLQVNNRTLYVPGIQDILKVPMSSKGTKMSKVPKRYQNIEKVLKIQEVPKDPKYSRGS